MCYAVIIEHDEETGSYGAYAPNLPGCGAAAASREEVLQLITEAIQFHIEGLRLDGLPISEPVSAAEYVEVPELTL
jgi:predicted RNase H-like HicB family nuclease